MIHFNLSRNVCGNSYSTRWLKWIFWIKKGINLIKRKLGIGKKQTHF
ncbi:hypothetical protein FD23_GL001762 [Lactobacillus delbrueckii subsp. delbrueckii DSM 20074 = JCM 1012]|nr:hypothetical protein FD23_GL001762 [Lactobacillus delbrueckii subsp. delbrueckii DSM 20074 = JCM 1012]